MGGGTVETTDRQTDRQLVTHMMTSISLAFIAYMDMTIFSLLKCYNIYTGMFMCYKT